MSAEASAIPFRIGARTFARVPRRLVRFALSLDQAIGGTPSLPPLGTADGYLLMSLPADSELPSGLLAYVRQRYRRYYADLTIGHAAWLATLSANTRSGIRRKARRLADASGGTLDIRCYHRPAGWAEFHALARPLSALTYQERLMDAGLPDDAAEVRDLLRLSGEDRLRAWLLFLDGRAIAYLCCTADGATLRYDYVGHDPAQAALSPGAVLHAEAMRELFEEGRFARFDFTEGEGQHKRQLATGSVACMDVLLLRPTLANRLAIGALAGWERAIGWGKRVAGSGPLARLAKLARR